MREFAVTIEALTGPRQHGESRLRQRLQVCTSSRHSQCMLKTCLVQRPASAQSATEGAPDQSIVAARKGRPKKKHTNEVNFGLSTSFRCVLTGLGLASTDSTASTACIPQELPIFRLSEACKVRRLDIKLLVLQFVGCADCCWRFCHASPQWQMIALGQWRC